MNLVWRWRLFIANLDPVIGSEQAGSRPVLVVSEEDYNQRMPLVTVLPLTSRKPGRNLYRNEVLLEAGTGGLSLDSIVLVPQVRTISKRRFVASLGYLEAPNKQEQILEILIKHLGMW